MANWDLLGIDELVSNLRKKLDEGAERVINKGLKTAGEIIAESMRDKVAVSDLETDTYTHIKDDIRVSSVRRKDGQKYVLIGAGKKTGWRTHFLEYGVIHARRAQPFIYPAFHENRDETLRILAEEFRRGLEEG